MSTDTLTTIAANRARPHPDNPRSELTEIKELAKSIAEVGVLERPVVRPVHDDPAFDVEILSGHRRFAAAETVNPLFPVPVESRDGLTDEEVEAILFFGNVQREALVASEIAAGLAKQLGFGKSIAWLATQVGRSKSWVSAHVKLMELPIEVRHLVDSDYLDLDDAGSLAKDLPRYEAQMVEWATTADEHRLNEWDWKNQIRELEAERVLQETYDKLIAAGDTVVTDPGDVPEGTRVVLDDGGTWEAKQLGMKLIAVDPKAHRKEDCHLSFLRATSYGAPKRFELCTKPSNHKGKGGSPLKAPTGAQTKTLYDKEKAAAEKLTKTRMLAALEAIVALPAKDTKVLVEDGVLKRTGAESAKAACLLLSIKREDWPSGYNGGDAPAAIREYAAKSGANRQRALVAVELAHRTFYNPFADDDVNEIAARCGFEVAVPATKEELDG